MKNYYNIYVRVQFERNLSSRKSGFDPIQLYSISIHNIINVGGYSSKLLKEMENKKMQRRKTDYFLEK